MAGMFTSLEQIVERAVRPGPLPSIAVAPASGGFILRAVQEARQSGIADAILIGDEKLIRAKAGEHGVEVGSFRIENEPDPHLAVRRAVELYRLGEAVTIMKGIVSTSVVLKAVLDKENGVPPKGILSHVSVFRSPREDRLMLLTDAGVNIRPNLQRKVDIVKNAIHVARRLGMERPRVAMLAATEKVNYPAMPATLDADLVAKMGHQGEFGDAEVAGPLALDIAVSLDAAACKNLSGPVVGCADVLVCPAIESGNVLYKSLTSFMNVPIAGVVVGSEVPIVVPSRGDSDRSKFFSIALAVFLASGESP